MKSIIQDKKECFITGSTQGLHNHHIFYGRANRKISDKYGLTIWLTNQCHLELHTSPPNAMFVDKVKALQIKQMAQKKAMEHYGWTVEEWIKKFGKSYI